MARHNSIRRPIIATLGILVAAAWCAPIARGQSTFQQAAAGNAIWHDTARWSAEGIPNAQDAEAIFDMPITSAPAGNGFTLNINDTDTTVGKITINNTGNPNAFVTRICGASNCSGQIIFDSSSGPATYTEDAGTPNTTNNGRFVINPNITLLSDLVVTQNNQPGLNTPTEFTGLITGDSNITFTKEGVANLQLTNNVSLFEDEGFFGQYVINAGGIRLIGRSAIRNSSGVTVNAGAQLQLADNASTNIPDWYMADDAVLTLNGNGKTTGTTTDGALRIGIQAGRTTTFHNPVFLESNSRINVAASNTTGVLDNVVSGPGGLNMFSNNNGTLILTNPDNSYTGDTQVLSGTLSITNTFLADGADVYLTTGATFNLNFTDIDDDIDDIRSLYIDGEAKEIGLWGATGNLDADFQTDLITGNGLLNVMVFPAPPGLDGDYNDDGFVDAADYVLWRHNEPTDTPLANDSSPGSVDEDDYDTWVANFGKEADSGAAARAEAVPEPDAILLAVFALCGLLAIAIRR